MWENLKKIFIESENSSLQLDIETDVEVLDSTKNLSIAYMPTNNLLKENHPGRKIGTDITINLEDYSYPRYTYPIQGTFCMVDGEVDGICRSVDAYVLDISYKPEIPEKPATITRYIDGVPAYEYFENNSISVGDTVEFSIELSDPNSLENQVRWIFMNNLTIKNETDWTNENESFTYTFDQEDVGAAFRVNITWRNNDGVALEWSATPEEGVFEVDGYSRLQFQVGE